MSDPVTATLVTIGIAGATLVCILHSLSSALMHQVEVIDLKRETTRLHNEHLKRLADLKAGRFGPPAEQLAQTADHAEAA